MATTGIAQKVDAGQHFGPALTSAGFHMEEAGLCQIAQQCEGALSNLRHSVLQHKPDPVVS